MNFSFLSPSEDQLADVDSADCEYEKTVVEIEGVVSASSQAGWPRSDAYDVHCFSFSAWRYPGEPIHNSKLTVLRPVASDGNWFSEYPKLSIHRIKVLLSVDKTRAIFAGNSQENANKNQLQEIAEKLSKPVVIKTERFGDFTLDRSIDWFEGDANWNGQTVRITFPVDGNHDISAGLKIAEELWDNQKEWKKKVDDFAVEELLPLKNATWLGEDESVHAREIQITTDNRVYFHLLGWFNKFSHEGNLFWGHSIQISGSLDEGLTQADIPG